MISENEFLTHLLELLEPLGSVEAKTMSYYQAPPDVMDNAEALCNWAQKAYDAALRAAQNKPKKKRGKH